jgi:hypothetical protein
MLCYHFSMGWLKGVIVAAAVALALPAPAQTQPQEIACRDRYKPMLRAELFFGRSIGARLGVSERQWARFLTRELTSRFPDGLTVIDGQGQWRDSERGAIVREPSKMVIVVTVDDAATRERIDAAAAAYKQQFHQRSVGVLIRPICASF